MSVTSRSLQTLSLSSFATRLPHKIGYLGRRQISHFKDYPQKLEHLQKAVQDSRDAAAGFGLLGIANATGGCMLTYMSMVDWGSPISPIAALAGTGVNAIALFALRDFHMVRKETQLKNDELITYRKALETSMHLNQDRALKLKNDFLYEFRTLLIVDQPASLQIPAKSVHDKIQEEQPIWVGKSVLNENDVSVMFEIELPISTELKELIFNSMNQAGFVVLWRPLDENDKSNVCTMQIIKKESKRKTNFLE